MFSFVPQQLEEQKYNGDFGVISIPKKYKKM
jgi:hypothetical protein